MRTGNCFANVLWFAWKIVLLQYRKQQITSLNLNMVSCDLLEKSYFCSIANNWQAAHGLDLIVVICLKNRTFAVSQTTTKTLLWDGSSCDLLEKSYFCSIANNRSIQIVPIVRVVICLKNRTFAVSQTTIRHGNQRCRSCDLLEKSYFCSIANNVVWRLSKRQRVVICLKNRTFAVSQTTNNTTDTAVSGCDLLEKSYFCSIANNMKSIMTL